LTAEKTCHELHEFFPLTDSRALSEREGKKRCEKLVKRIIRQRFMKFV